MTGTTETKHTAEQDDVMMVKVTHWKDLIQPRPWPINLAEMLEMFPEHKQLTKGE